MDQWREARKLLSKSSLQCVMIVASWCCPWDRTFLPHQKSWVLVMLRQRISNSYIFVQTYFLEWYHIFFWNSWWWIIHVTSYKDELKVPREQWNTKRWRKRKLFLSVPMGIICYTSSSVCSSIPVDNLQYMLNSAFLLCKTRHDSLQCTRKAILLLIFYRNTSTRHLCF